MKKVLWVSRHEMTQLQRSDLERIMGGPVELIPWRETIRDVKELAPLLRKADAVAAVLPPEPLSELLQLADGKPVLQAVSERQTTGRTIRNPNGQTELEFAYRHLCWKQLLRLEIETRTL